MSMAEVDHIDLEVKGLSLLDDGAENDDFVLTLSPSPLKQTDNHKGLSLEMSGTMDVQEEDMDNKGEEDDVLPELHESMEPERSRRKGKLNLRKSLAWDSAFFTDAGVLDAEELSCMVKGAEKIEKNVMPRIEEDVERSTDTISTLASDSVALEHLEAELFEDIRASIQRSNKVSNVMTSTRKEVSSVADNGGNSASKKADATLKNVPVKTGDLTSSLAKLPKLPSKANPIPATMAKRASLSANHVKIDHDNTKTNTVAGKGAHTSKVFDSSNACKALPKPALSSKASSMRFSAASKMQSSRSSSDSTGSTLSDKAGKPNLPMARRKLVKSVRTPNGTMQKQSTALPKIGTTLCSPNGRSNMKSKASGLPPSRMSTASGNVKSGTQNLSSPTSFQDKSQSPTLLNIADAPKDNQSFPSFAPEVHHEPKEESNSYVMDVGSGVHDTVKHVVQDAGLEAVNHGDLGVLKNEMTANVNEKANSNDIKVVAVEEETTYSNSKNADTTISEIAASRIPFAVKNSEDGDFLDFSKEAVIEEVVGKINSVIPLEIDYKENNNL
nr:uncharacterized protein LOC109185922 isoform X1 [Ipomoea trifida]